MSKPIRPMLVEVTQTWPWKKLGLVVVHGDYSLLPFLVSDRDKLKLTVVVNDLRRREREATANEGRAKVLPDDFDSER